MDTYEGILSRMQERFSALAGYSADDASDIGIRMRVLAGELYSLTAAVEWIKRQAFAQTAQGEELDLRAAERGLTRKPAQIAAGSLTFRREKPLWYNAVIEQGTVCATAGQMRFVTTEQAVLKTGQTEVTVPARAETGGRSGNAAAGTVTVLVTPPPSLESVTNLQAFAGGQDAETDAALRERLLRCYADLPNGTNAAFYREQAMKIDGVFSAGVVPQENGAGTVNVYLGAQGTAADAETVRLAQERIDALREIGVKVHVASAQTVSCNVSVRILQKAGIAYEMAEAAVKEAAKDYFSSLGVGDGVLTAALGARLFDAGVLRNYLFLSNSTLDRPMRNNQLAVLGTVSVQSWGGSGA